MSSEVVQKGESDSRIILSNPALIAVFLLFFLLVTIVGIDIIYPKSIALFTSSKLPSKECNKTGTSACFSKRSRESRSAFRVCDIIGSSNLLAKSIQSINNLFCISLIFGSVTQ